MSLLAEERRAIFRAQLVGPTVPTRVQYLLDWTMQIHGRSGIGMSGYAPATYATLESWQRLFGVDDLTAREAQLLLALDAVLCAFDPATYDPKKEPSFADAVSGRT